MPAKSKSQRRLMGWVYAYKTGKVKNAPKKIRQIAKGISKEDARDFAKTKSNGLPEKKACWDVDFRRCFVRGFLTEIRNSLRR